ncbi:hypothetical protein V6N13_070633 [Hibiscus sabdariffa]
MTLKPPQGPVQSVRNPDIPLLNVATQAETVETGWRREGENWFAGSFCNLQHASTKSIDFCRYSVLCVFGE